MPMQDLRILGMPQLADLLNKEMSRYYILIGDREKIQDFLRCKMTIRNIQQEIDRRKTKVFQTG